MYKILVADDEKALRMLVKGTLEIGNYNIIEAENGIDVLYMVATEKPDLIILDVMMPGMTGYEVCEEIKSKDEFKDTKILILTAKGQQTDKEKAKKVMADYYLSKPFSPAKLLSVVEEILGE
ncbi:MAG: response regulator [Firmicutes bacterium]|nr:response regulator [Bacillota bacterium]